MQWDPDNCLCICPIAEWKVCSSGYIFDFTNTCQCVPTSTEASMGLIAAIIVLIRWKLFFKSCTEDFLHSHSNRITV